MTKIKKIADLCVGDEIVVTIRTKVIEKEDRYRDEAPYVNTSFDYVDGECVAFTDFELSKDSFTVERVAKPLPTKNGVYVPATNADTPEYSYLYLYSDTNGDGPWTLFNGNTAMTGLAAKEEVERAHNYLGGLIPLTAQGADE